MATVDVVDALPVASEEAQPSVVQILSKEPVVEDAEMKSTIVTNGDSTHELELPTEGEEVVMDSKPDADPVLSSGLEDNNAIPADRSTFVEVEQSTSGDAKEGGTDPQKVDADATGAPDSAVDDNLDIVLEKKDVEEGQAVEVQGEEFPETTQVIDKSIIVQEGLIDVAVQDINDAEQTSDISTNSETPSVAVTGHNSKSHHSEHSSLDIDHTSVQPGSLQEEVADSTAEKPAKNLFAQDVDDMIDAQSTAEIIPTPAVAESIEKGTDLASAAEQYPVTQTDINDTVPVESSVATDSQASVEESIEMPADKLTGEPVDTNDHFPTEVAEPPVSPESSVSAKDEADGISIAGNDNVPTELEVAQPAAPVEAEELVSQSEPLAEPIKKVISAPVESSNLEPEAVKEGVPTAEVVENTTSDEGVPTEETALPQSRVSDDVVSTADLQTSLDDNVASSASQASASELQQVEDVPAVSETENIVPVEEDANIAAAQGVASHNEDLLTPAQDSALVEDVLRHSEVEELINAAPETEIEPVAEPPSQAVVDENAMEDKPIASAVSVEGIDNDAIDAIVENLTSSLPDSEPVDPELKTDQNAESSETPIADSVDAAVQESVPDILVVVSEPETQTHSKQFAEGNASALVEEISESSVIPESQVFSAEAIETAGATQADELVSGHKPAATESGLDSGSDVPEEAAAEDVSAQVEEITPVEDTISETPSIVEPPASESESAVPAIYAEIGESESTTHSFEAPAEVQPVPEVELVIDQSEPPVVTTQLQEADVELAEPTQNEEFIPETEISVSTDSEALLEDGIEDQLRVEEASTHVEKAAKPLVDEQVEANVSKEAEEEFVPSSVPSEPQASEIPLTETEFVGESAPVMSITESQTSIDVSVEDTTADKLPEPTVPSNESKLNDTQAIPAESAPITIESSAGEEEMKPLITPIIVTEDSQDVSIFSLAFRICFTMILSQDPT
ncbi:hypothetical protein K435DRAFT_299677 [Dendrothele bispora CBS 962.96]|uniref:Uncharacterized protein n=1 Tax=Dendrothele bispora (strain CBS 962.96) TaxID=1314807 RepID=A0A4S8ML56_DENBC|nr:hypothetical protein K435DRAFT_299677 [Dendrothele bispora CBS 962.96]